jgi:hypothetical protein
LGLGVCFLGLAYVVTVAAPVRAQALEPRTAVIKPTQTAVNPVIHKTEIITVKFKDGLPVRLRNGALANLDSEALGAAPDISSGFAGGTWERTFDVPEEKLDALRATAEFNLGRAVADLNLQFNLILPDGVDAAKTIDALNALDCVEIALPSPRPVVPPTPNYQSNQGYLNAATSGVGAICMWQLPGGTGLNSAIADLEYSWNMSHNDLGTITLLGATPNDPFNNDNHGTAVLGEFGALSNGWGVTGIAYGSAKYVVATNTGSGSGTWDVGAAVMTALGTLTAGDVILIEQQMAGPNYTGSPPGTQYGLVPVEWYQPWYNAIVTAVGNGVVVVEAAGNGSQNLDAAIYSTGNGGHWPFLPANDSGAIIVGAGASPGGSDTDRSRLSYSNYGSTLDLQGWGENVYTTGYGSLYSAEGKNKWYTATFSGTSSASPIVAGACLLLQSTYYAGTKSFLPPGQVRLNLRTTGSAQQAGTYPTSQNIGPRPNASAALCNALPAIDSNANFVPDLCDGLAGLEACCFPTTGCTDTTPTNCMAYGGTPQGAGTSCATTACPVTEACCFVGLGTPYCLDRTPATCAASGGIPQGPGTTCATMQCQAILPKFNQSPSLPSEGIASNLDINTMMPNTVAADDFQSNGNRTTVVRWWGSYPDARYMPVAYGGLPSPFQIDGWLISFHEPLAPTGMFLPALGVYFANAADVAIMSSGTVGCDGRIIFMYTAELRRCCLMSSMPDSRSGLLPAQPSAFGDEWCRWYDIGIQAVVGMSYVRHPQTGVCLPMGSQNMGMGNNFWAWNTTTVEMGQRSALTGMAMPGPIGAPWNYGPWAFPLPVCAPTPVNMALGLYTDNPATPNPCPTCACLGDMDGSNFIDGNDVQGFVGCLLGVPPPGVNCQCADMDGLNGADLNDVPLFVNRLLNNPTCP